MRSAAEIIFVGLCSFLNVQNTVNYDMPPPSVIVLDEKDHTAFIAFDGDEVEVVDGNGTAMGKAVPNSTLKYIKLDGEELVVLNAPQGLPVVATSFDAIASASRYAPESKSDLYDEAYVPRWDAKTKGRPHKGKVSAFLRFSGGDLARGRLTNVPFVFQLPDETEKTLSGRFAEEGIYSFPADRIQLEALDLSSQKTTRVLTFLHKQSGQGSPSGIRIWIGAAPFSGTDAASGIAGTIRGKQQGPYQDAVHLTRFNKMFKPSQTTGLKKTVDRIPHPLKEFQPSSMAKMKHSSGRPQESVGEDSGYCGPDQKP